MVKWGRLTHGLKNEINVLVILSPDDIQQLDNVGVLSKFLQDTRANSHSEVCPGICSRRLFLSSSEQRIPQGVGDGQSVAGDRAELR